MGLDNLTWKLKSLFRKALPWLVVGLVAYGGYNMYRRGYFRHGVGSAVTRVLHQVPYFGSRFRHFGGEPSYAYAPAHSSYHASHATYRSHGRRRHSRRSRHHRRYR
jgi:hypothetical protein